jgi:hypothetical protein
VREFIRTFLVRAPFSGIHPSRHSVLAMRHQIGVLLQFLVLVFLPMLIIWQLNFGFRLILMPALTLVAIVVFWIGYKLREGS